MEGKRHTILWYNSISFRTPISVSHLSDQRLSDGREPRVHRTMFKFKLFKVPRQVRLSLREATIR